VIRGIPKRLRLVFGVESPPAPPCAFEPPEVPAGAAGPLTKDFTGLLLTFGEIRAHSS
jgi:hypothetical protein